ncbi:MAG: argininosuccinate lyase [Planctomycetes bacterium]|nr:argininosuccinate lyase [Planctomycetota bacterium]
MNKKKPWQGRFTKPTSTDVEAFTESVSFDWQLYKYDIEGSIAHATMLAKCALITNTERDKIIKGLREIQNDIESGDFVFKEHLEDVHMNIESALIERIGDAGKKLHTARSRNDQVALDMRLWMRDQIKILTKLLTSLQYELVLKGKANIKIIVPGFTHLQHAQPVLLAHYLLAYVEMFERDKSRLRDCLWLRLSESPLGACALAGTTLPIYPEFTANLLGFYRVCDNSVDAVSDRDFCIEFVFCLSMIAMHLSRLSEEWIMWSSQEFDFINIDDSYCTGSSIMPQKKNPDVLELIRGKCARVYGNLTTLLSLMKGLPLAYNRDMQEDKEAVFGAYDTVKRCLSLITGLVKNTRFKAEIFARACEDGFLDATALAEYLVLKGIPFRQAHEIVGSIVKNCIKTSRILPELGLDTLKKYSPVIDEDVYKVLGTENCIRSYKSPGSTAPKLVRKQINEWEKRLSKQGEKAKRSRG